MPSNQKKEEIVIPVHVEEEDDGVETGCPLWMVTFGDAISLLMTFFVMVLSFTDLSVEAEGNLDLFFDTSGGAAQVLSIGSDSAMGSKVIGEDDISTGEVEQEEYVRIDEEVSADKMQSDSLDDSVNQSFNDMSNFFKDLVDKANAVGLFMDGNGVDDSSSKVDTEGTGAADSVKVSGDGLGDDERSSEGTANKETADREIVAESGHGDYEDMSGDGVSSEEGGGLIDSVGADGENDDFVDVASTVDGLQGLGTGQKQSSIGKVLKRKQDSGYDILVKERFIFLEGRTRVRSEAVPVLKQIGQLLSGLPNDFVLQSDGTLPSDGAFSDHSSPLTLSLARSVALKKYFVDIWGIDQERMSISMPSAAAGMSQGVCVSVISAFNGFTRVQEKQN